MMKRMIPLVAVALLGIAAPVSLRAQESTSTELNVGQLIQVITPADPFWAQQMELVVRGFLESEVPVDLSGCKRAGPYVGTAIAIVTGKMPPVVLSKGFSEGGVHFSSDTILPPGTRLLLEPLPSANYAYLPLCIDTDDTSPRATCTCTQKAFRNAIVLSP